MQTPICPILVFLEDGSEWKFGPIKRLRLTPPSQTCRCFVAATRPTEIDQCNESTSIWCIWMSSQLLKEVYLWWFQKGWFGMFASIFVPCQCCSPQRCSQPRPHTCSITATDDNGCYVYNLLIFELSNFSIIRVYKVVNKYFVNQWLL